MLQRIAHPKGLIVIFISVTDVQTNEDELKRVLSFIELLDFASMTAYSDKVNRGNSLISTSITD